MKHIPFYFLLVTLFATPAISYPAGEKKIKVGIMKFEVSKNIAPSLGTLLYDTLLDNMLQSNRFTVVDGDEIDRIQDSITKTHPEISRQEAKKRTIDQMGIRKLYVGTLSKIGSKFYLTVKVLKADATVERMEKSSTASEDGLETCIQKSAANLLLSPETLQARAAAAKIQKEAVRRHREAQRGKEVGRDGRFIAYSQGLIKDTTSGLMWAARDNGSDITWSGARSYCKNYKGAGYRDWRMPTQDELAGLYDSGKKNRLGYFVTELIHITACCPWASDSRGSEAASFSFYSGARYWLQQSSDYHNRRALPVRAD